jgi:hypothetical protein
MTATPYDREPSSPCRALPHTVLPDTGNRHAGIQRAGNHDGLVRASTRVAGHVARGEDGALRCRRVRPITPGQLLRTGGLPGEPHEGPGLGGGRLVFTSIGFREQAKVLHEALSDRPLLDGADR